MIIKYLLSKIKNEINNMGNKQERIKKLVNQMSLIKFIKMFYFIIKYQ